MTSPCFRRCLAYIDARKTIPERRDTQQQAAAEAAPEQIQEASTEEPKQESTDKADLGAAQSAPANGDDLFSQIGSGEADVGDYLRFGREMGAAPVQGGVDFAVGLRLCP